MYVCGFPDVDAVYLHGLTCMSKPAQTRSNLHHADRNAPGSVGISLNLSEAARILSEPGRICGRTLSQIRSKFPRPFSEERRNFVSRPPNAWSRPRGICWIEPIGEPALPRRGRSKPDRSDDPQESAGRSTESGKSPPPMTFGLPSLGPVRITIQCVGRQAFGHHGRANSRNAGRSLPEGQLQLKSARFGRTRRKFSDIRPKPAEFGASLAILQSTVSNELARTRPGIAAEFHRRPTLPCIDQA